MIFIQVEEEKLSPFSYITGGSSRKREIGETWHFIPLIANGRAQADYRQPHRYDD